MTRTPLLRPRWLAGHTLAVSAVLVFVLLGAWQLRRHDEKVELRDVVAAAVAAAPTPISEVPEGAFANVWMIGEFSNDLEARLLRSRGGVSGYEVLTPVILEDGTALLVDRGWVALDVDSYDAPPSGAVKIGGVLWPAQEVTAVSESMPEYVRGADPAIFERFSEASFRSEYLVLTEISPFDPEVLQLPEIGEVSLGPHLGYAGQWFLFAGVVLVGYPLLLRRRAQSSAITRQP
jgi:surfeit locus 1 family protein